MLLLIESCWSGNNIRDDAICFILVESLCVESRGSTLSGVAIEFEVEDSIPKLGENVEDSRGTNEPRQSSKLSGTDAERSDS